MAHCNYPERAGNKLPVYFIYRCGLGILLTTCGDSMEIFLMYMLVMAPVRSILLQLGIANFTRNIRKCSG